MPDAIAEIGVAFIHEMGAIAGRLIDKGRFSALGWLGGVFVVAILAVKIPGEDISKLPAILVQSASTLLWTALSVSLVGNVAFLALRKRDRQYYLGEIERVVEARKVLEAQLDKNRQSSSVPQQIEAASSAAPASGGQAEGGTKP
jgi:hypothetical protein